MAPSISTSITTSGAQMQSQPALGNTERARNMPQASHSQSYPLGNGYAGGTSNSTRRVEPLLPSAAARFTASKSLPPAPDRNLRPQPTGDRPTAPRKGLGSRAPSEVPFDKHHPAPARAPSQAPVYGRALSQAPPAPTRAPSRALVYSRAPSQAPPNARAPAQVPPRALNTHAHPQPSAQLRVPSRAPSPYSNPRAVAGNPGRSRAPSQAPTRPRSQSPVFHPRARSNSRASLGYRAASQAPIPPREQRTIQQPQTRGIGGELNQFQLTGVEHEFLIQALEASRASGICSTSGPTTRNGPSHGSSSSSRSLSHQNQAQRNSTRDPHTRGRSHRGNHTREPVAKDDEMDDADEFSDSEGIKENRGKRGRLNHFSGTEYKILGWAGRVYQVLMLVRGMYETDTDVLDGRRLEAWEIACEKYNKTTDKYPFRLSHMQNMNDRLVTWRFHATKYIRDKAASEYFPKANTMTTAELEALIKQLKAGGLHTKPGAAAGFGCFQHPLLQMCMNEMVFRFKRDLGVQFPEYFRQATAELVCFFCAILQFVVEEREIGKSGKGELHFEAQRKAYNTHLTSHGVWVGLAEDRWKLVQKQLFLRGFKNSGASESALPVEMKDVLREEDLQPDVPDDAELAAWEEEVEEFTSKKRGDPRGWERLEYEEPLEQDPDNPIEFAQPPHTNRSLRSASDDDDQDGAPHTSSSHDNGLRGAVYNDRVGDHAYDGPHMPDGYEGDPRHRVDRYHDRNYSQTHEDPRYLNERDNNHVPEYINR
ncbi:hypothetical protein V565_275130, partial [Rhizoctonia solani 123E]